MRLLFLGDVVGRSGRTAIVEALPDLRERYRVDFVVVNGENAAGGFGITEAILMELLDAGADVVTTGNHVWDQREALVFIERQPRLLRPINYPPGTPGRGSALVDAKNGARAFSVHSPVAGRVLRVPLPSEASVNVGTPLIEIGDTARLEVVAELPLSPVGKILKRELRERIAAALAREAAQRAPQ